jgi:hypothetical protein
MKAKIVYYDTLNDNGYLITEQGVKVYAYGLNSFGLSYKELLQTVSISTVFDNGLLCVKHICFGGAYEGGVN